MVYVKLAYGDRGLEKLRDSLESSLNDAAEKNDEEGNARAEMMCQTFQLLLSECALNGLFCLAIFFPYKLSILCRKQRES